MTVVAAALSYSGQCRAAKSAATRSWQAALAAAQAGVDDYLAQTQPN